MSNPIEKNPFIEQELIAKKSDDCVAMLRLEKQRETVSKIGCVSIIIMLIGMTGIACWPAVAFALPTSFVVSHPALVISPLILFSTVFVIGGLPFRVCATFQRGTREILKDYEYQGSRQFEPEWVQDHSHASFPLGNEIGRGVKLNGKTYEFIEMKQNV